LIQYKKRKTDISQKMQDQVSSKKSNIDQKGATALVLGATGATGKYVVKQLLEKGFNVKAIVRSVHKMQSLLSSMEGFKFDDDKLYLKEANVLDLTDEDFLELIIGCQAVVICLGHNLSFSGIFGHPRNLVAEAIKRTCDTIQKVMVEKKNISNDDNPQKTKVVLMGTDGIPHPEGTDDIRTFSERFMLRCLHYTLPPHSDNEDAMGYLYNTIGKSNTCLEWVIVRPADLLDGGVTKYEINHKPNGSLFGGDSHTIRANAAQFMVDLITNIDLWSKWVFAMPVVTDVLT